MNLNKIGNTEAIALVIIVTIAHIILNLPQYILNTTSTSSILNIIYVSIIALIICYIVYRLFQYFPGQDIFDVGNFLGGTWLKNFIGIAYILYFIFIASLLVRNFSESLKLIYFPNFPVVTIILVFLIGTTIVNKIGFTSIIRCNLIISPLVLIAMLILFFSTSDQFIWQRALPLLGKGINETFIKGTSNIYAFGGIAMLYLISPVLYKQKDLKKVGLFSIGASSIYLILGIASLLLMFPFITNTETLLSIYISTREMNFGEFIQRTDAIFILIWTLAIFSYLSIIIAYTLNFIKKTIRIKFSKPMVYSVTSLIFAFSLIPENIAQMVFTENTIYKYVVISLVFIISPLVLLFGVLKKKRQDKNIQSLVQLSEEEQNL